MHIRIPITPKNIHPDTCLPIQWHRNGLDYKVDAKDIVWENYSHSTLVLESGTTLVKSNDIEFTSREVIAFLQIRKTINAIINSPKITLSKYTDHLENFEEYPITPSFYGSIRKYLGTNEYIYTSDGGPFFRYSCGSLLEACKYFFPGINTGKIFLESTVRYKNLLEDFPNG